MEVMSVSQLNAYIKVLFQKEEYFQGCMVSGTVTNLNKIGKHIYFTLKDESAAINVNLFYNVILRKPYVKNIENGLFITVQGTLDYYEVQGRISIKCEDIWIQQKSPLQIQFEALKQELEALGYFSPLHKQEIPVFPKIIGIITSASGAVLHDILKVAKKRNPLVKFKLFAVPVQGQHAGPKIAKAIALANEDKELDLLIVGRGGGSMEDLWCFNDRKVVEALFESKIPVLSAVGHETDFTLCDFAADMRCATPSHAAEVAVFPLQQLQEEVRQHVEYLYAFSKRYIERKRRPLEQIVTKDIVLPMTKLITQEKNVLWQYYNMLSTKMLDKLHKEELYLHGAIEGLKRAHPIKRMLGGYARIEHNGRRVEKVVDLSVHDSVVIQFMDGKVEAEVKEVLLNGEYQDI